MIRETKQVQNSTYYMIHFVLKVQNSQINRYRKGFPRDTNGKEPGCQRRRQEMQVQSLGQEDPPGGEHGNPLQYSCLENPMDRGAWQATVHSVAKSGI